MTARKKATKKKATKKKTAAKKAPARKETEKQVATGKSTTGEGLSAADRKQAIKKIKKFVTQRDYDIIDTGIELARSLDDPGVFAEILEGCAFGKAESAGPYYRGSAGFDDADGQPIRNKFFFASAMPAQPYLDYALLEFIANAPEAADIHASLKVSNVTILVTNASNWTRLPPGISNFEKLSVLNLRNCRSLTDLKGLANCTMLTSVTLDHCNSLGSVSDLRGLTKLSELFINADRKFIDLPNLKPKPAEAHMITRREVAAYQKRIKG
jgi:hypothetical protein